MKPYGLNVIEWPDVGDIQTMASKSSTGRYKTKSGEYKSYIRGSSAKKTQRRKWKKLARRNSKKEIRNQLYNL